MKLLILILSIIFLIEKSSFADLPEASVQNNEIMIPQNPTTPYQVGDLICVKMPAGDTACGKVLSSGSDVVRLDLKPTAEGVEIVGEKPKEVKPEISPVIPAPLPSPSPSPSPTKKKSKKKPQPSPSPSPVASPLPSPSPEVLPSPTPVPSIVPPPPSVSLDSTKESKCPGAFTQICKAEDDKLKAQQALKPELPKNAIGLGLALGTNFYMVGLGFERLLIDHLALEGLGFFSTGSTSTSDLSSWGGLGRALYFLEKREGLYLSGFMGFYSVRSTIKSSQNVYSLNVFAIGGSAGYRLVLSPEISLNAEGGIQHLSHLSGDASQIDFIGLVPFCMFQFKFHF